MPLRRVSHSLRNASRINISKIIIALLLLLLPDNCLIGEEASATLLRDNPIGITEWFEFTQNHLKYYLEKNLKYVHYEIHWSEVEIAPGVYKWGKYDTFFERAMEGQFEVIVSIWDAPYWLDGGPERLRCDEAVEAFRRFFSAVVRRYEPGGFYGKLHGMESKFGIRYWKIWIEADRRLTSENDEKIFARLLEAAHEVIETESPDAQLIAGFGLDIPPETGPNGRKGKLDGDAEAKRYLSAFYELDMKDYFDILSYQNYSSDPDIWRSDDPAMNNFHEERGAAIRGVMKEYGDQKKEAFIIHGAIVGNQKTAVRNVLTAQAELLSVPYVSLICLGNNPNEPGQDKIGYDFSQIFDALGLQATLLKDHEFAYFTSTNNDQILIHAFSAGNGLYTYQIRTTSSVLKAKIPIKNAPAAVYPVKGAPEIVSSKDIGNSIYADVALTQDPLFLVEMGECNDLIITHANEHFGAGGKSKSRPLSKQQPMTDDEENIRFIVQNLGDKAMDSVLVAVKCGDRIVDQKVISLPANSQKQEHFHLPSKFAQKVKHVEVDPLNVISERFESNNRIVCVPNEGISQLRGMVLTKSESPFGGEPKEVKPKEMGSHGQGKKNPKPPLEELPKEKGRPVLGARVELWSNGKLIGTTYSVKGGSYEFEIGDSMNLSELRVRIKRIGFKSVEVTPCADQINIIEPSVEELGIVEGKISVMFAETGRRRILPTFLTDSSGTVGVYTGKKGDFRIPDMPAGNTEMIAKWEEFSGTHRYNVPSGNIASADIEVIVKGYPGKLLGTVDFGKTKSIVGLKAAVYTSNTSRTAPVSSTIVNSNGEFLIDGLMPGECYFVQLKKNDKPLTKSELFEVPLAGTAELHFELGKVSNFAN